MIYVRPDVDITFKHPETAAVCRIGIYVRRDTATYTTSRRKLEGHQLSGNLLKISAWDPSGLYGCAKLAKHVTSTPLVGSNFPTHPVNKTNELDVGNTTSLLTG